MKHHRIFPNFLTNPFLAGLLVVIAINTPLLTHSAALNWDASDEMLLYFRWMGSALRQGTFPDFFPQVLSGYPLGANPQTGVYNPLYLLSSALFSSSYLGINLVYTISISLIYGLGYAIGKTYSLLPISSMYLGLALVGSGFIIGHSSHLSYMATALGLLCIFLSARVACTQTVFSPPILWLSFAGAYHMLTAGYPQNTLFGIQCLSIYWIVQFYRLPLHRKNLGWLALGGLLGLAMSYPALSHFFHLLQLSDRGEGVSVNAALTHSLPRYALLNFIAPTWHVGQSEITMERFHLLWLSPLFLLFTLFTLLRNNEKISKNWILILLLVSLVTAMLALGKYSPIPLREWLAEHFFIYRTGRNPSGEHRAIALFCLALLSAFGLNILLKKFTTWHKIIALLVIADFCLVNAQFKEIRYHTINPDIRFPLFKATFSSAEQNLINYPRHCISDSNDWAVKTIIDNRDHLAPNAFSWNAYIGLRDARYDLERNQNIDFICGASRLWDLKTRQPITYELFDYSPGYIKLKLGNTTPGETDTTLIWSDYTDGLWKLSINGHPAPLTKGPADLRQFSGKSNDLIEMHYQGPLSQIWR